MLIISNRINIEQAKASIGLKWKCEDLRPTKMFVGFQIERNRPAKSLFIHHALYATKLVERFRMEKSNPTVLPIPAGTVLKLRKEYTHTTDDAADELRTLTDTETRIYQQIVGSLIYLSNGTRLDLSYPVGQLARHMADPLILHLRLAKQVLRYLNRTKGLGIRYRPLGNP